MGDVALESSKLVSEQEHRFGAQGAAAEESAQVGLLGVEGGAGGFDFLRELIGQNVVFDLRLWVGYGDRSLRSAVEGVAQMDMRGVLHVHVALKEANHHGLAHRVEQLENLARNRLRGRL